MLSGRARNPQKNYCIVFAPVAGVETDAAPPPSSQHGQPLQKCSLEKTGLGAEQTKP